MHELKATEDLEAATLVGIIPGWGTPAPSPRSWRGRRSDMGSGSGVSSGKTRTMPGNPAQETMAAMPWRR